MLSGFEIVIINILTRDCALLEEAKSRQIEYWNERESELMMNSITGKRITCVPRERRKKSFPSKNSTNVSTS